jgi:hypothetical protein
MTREQVADKVVIPKGTMILEGTVAPNFWQPSGGLQIYIPDPSYKIIFTEENQMEKFKQNVLKAIQLCNEEIQRRNAGIEGESSQKELEEVILPELNAIVDLLGKNQLPSRESRFLNSFAHAFKVWGWDMREPTELFLLLNKLDKQYKEL